MSEKNEFIRKQDVIKAINDAELVLPLQRGILYMACARETEEIVKHGIIEAINKLPSNIIETGEENES